MSQLVQGVRVVGDAAMQYAQKQKEQADLTALMAARRELSDWEANTFDPANPDGIGKFKGQNALGANEALLPDLDQRVSQIRQRLRPDQQQRFDQVAFSFRDTVQGRLTSHMDREYSAYQSTEQKASLDNIAQDAVSAGMGGDFGLADVRIQESLGMARAAYQAQGFGEEAIKASERGIVSSVRRQTLAALVTRDPFAAEDYYERFADQMIPEDRALAERTLYPYLEDRQADVDADWAEQGGQDPIRQPAARGRPSSEVASAIDDAARKYGVPKEDLYALAEQESSFNPSARNPEALDDGDHAEGLFQYRRTTSAALGNFDRRDAKASAEAAARQYRERMDKHGREYAIAAHFAGDGGAEAVVVRGRTAENPKTAMYVRQVLGRSARWRGEVGGSAEGAIVAAPGRAASKGDALARVSAIADPRRRGAAERRLKDRWEIQRLQQDQAEQAGGMAIYEKVVQSPAGTPISQVLAPGEMALLARDAGLSAAVGRLREMQASGQIVQDDPVTLDRIHFLQGTNPTEFARIKLAEYSDRLSGETIKKLATEQRQANDPAKRADWMTDSERLNAGFRMVGIGQEGDVTGAGSAKKNEPRDRMRGEFRIAYQNAYTAYVQRQGKKPSPEDADALLRAVTKQFAQRQTAGFAVHWSDDGLGARISRGTTAIYPAGEKYQMQIGEGERAEIVADFRADKGRNPTDAEIMLVATRARQREAK